MRKWINNWLGISITTEKIGKAIRIEVESEKYNEDENYQNPI